MNGRSLGSLIGAVGGAVFVLVNAGEMSGSTLLRVVALVLLLAALAAVALPSRPAPPPSSRAVRVYGWCVLAEVVAIPVGARVLVQLDHGELVRAWVVLVVGVHFLPFAGAFRAPVFRWLGGLLVVVAIAGAVLVLRGVEDGGPWTQVLAGLVLLGFSIGGELAAGVRRAGRPLDDAPASETPATGPGT